LKRFIDQCDSTNINLSDYQLNDQDIPTIIHSAIVKKKCIELKLCYNNITYLGIEILAKALSNNTTLERLNLFNNYISDEGVYHLTRVLSLNNSKLNVLFLGQNQITNKGIEHISEMLKTNQILTQLGLSNNKISDQGVILLANTLAYRNTTLKELYLWGNKSIGDDCIDALANMLVYNRSLNRLILFDCNLSESSKTRLREVVEPRINFGLFL
jgi:Ran GTPase-activating protein (RanGAP) involved in mRNA processing and transport